MLKTQEPKYTAHLVDGDCKIVVRETADRVPDDEPVFIFRGKDPFAVSVLAYYASILEENKVSEDHISAVLQRLDDFCEFKKDNPSRCSRFPTT